MKVHYPKLYNMAHLSLNVFTASKGSNNYILFNKDKLPNLRSWYTALVYQSLGISRPFVT